jgi:peptide/nickel transport system substrate-binding protein
MNISEPRKTQLFKREVFIPVKKSILFLVLSLVLAGVIVLAGCGGPVTTTPGATTPSQTTPTAGQPVSGGTLRIISGAIPKNLGYAPEKAPSDTYFMLPVLERLCAWGDTSGNLVGILATSWETDHTENTITWHLRQGVEFTDGTPFNAEAVRWNQQLAIDNRTGSGTNLIESLEVTGEYTIVYHMISFDWQTIQNLGLLQCISPTSYLTAGGTIASGSDEEASKAWAREHAVGTGPFTVSEWVQDDHITFVKNPSYWQAGKPYLDEIVMRMVTDPSVASAAMQANEADIWNDTNSVQDIKNLQDKGFKINMGPGMFTVILMSSANPDNPLSNIKVREAIEYALDRPTMAQTLGQGLYEPFTQMASSTWPGYVPGYDPRPFNTDMAIELLDQAGFSQGLTMKVLAASGGNTNDVMSLLTYYLGLAGITVEPDVADLGRYFGTLFSGGAGWDDLCLTASGINPDASDIAVHYGPNPLTFRTTNMYKSQAFIDLCNEAIAPEYNTAAEAMDKIRAAVRQAGEDCLFIPLWRTAEAAIMQTYVHTEYPKIHGIIWNPADDWMEAH